MSWLKKAAAAVAGVAGAALVLAGIGLAIVAGVATLGASIRDSLKLLQGAAELVFAAAQFVVQGTELAANVAVNTAGAAMARPVIDSVPVAGTVAQSPVTPSAPASIEYGHSYRQPMGPSYYQFAINAMQTESVYGAYQQPQQQQPVTPAPAASRAHITGQGGHPVQTTPASPAPNRDVQNTAQAPTTPAPPESQITMRRR